jgi:hypothetical protein
MSSKAKAKNQTSTAEAPAISESPSDRLTFEEVVQLECVVIKTTDPRSVGVPAGGIVFGAEARRYDTKGLLSLGDSAVRFIVSHPDLSISVSE